MTHNMKGGIKPRGGAKIGPKSCVHKDLKKYQKVLDKAARRWYNVPMKMTRSHFQALATLCADIIVENNFTKNQCISIIDSFSDVCQRSNSQFDANRFAEWVQNILQGN